jgi:hypothetical protein
MVRSPTSARVKGPSLLADLPGDAVYGLLAEFEFAAG